MLENIGDDPMQLVSALGMAPVRVKNDAGEELSMPWD